MTCYVTKIKPPSKAEYDIWVSLGFLGSYERYCRLKHDVGAKVFICGTNLGPHCAHCEDFGDILCDFPVAEGKTCDLPLCDNHSREIAPDLHYCGAHYSMWQAFKSSGGVEKSLKNIIAFKGEK